MSAERPLLSATKSFNDLAARLRPKAITVEDQFYMNPLEKFRRYRIVPFKLVLTVSMLVLLLLYVFTFHLRTANSAINTRFALASNFFTPIDNTDTSLLVSMSTIPLFISALQQITRGYYSVAVNSPGVYMTFMDPVTEQPVPPLMTIAVRNASAILGDASPTQLRVLSYPLTMASPTGPFSSHASIKALLSALTNPTSCTPILDGDGNSFVPCRNSSSAALFDHVFAVNVAFELMARFYVPDEPAPHSVTWSVSFDFSFSSQRSAISMQAALQHRSVRSLSTVALVVLCLLVPAALCDCMLRLRSFHRYHLFMTMFVPAFLQGDVLPSPRSSPAVDDGGGDTPTGAASEAQNNEERPEAAAETHAEDWERRYISRTGGHAWTFFGILTDATILLFALAAILNSVVHWPVSLTLETVFVGFSTTFSSFMLISYLQTVPRFYLLMKALGIALPHLGIYLIGIFPVFVGFALCGVAVFGGFTNTFNTFPNAMVTLFCTLNGDSLLQMFTTIDQTNFLPMKIFSHVFLCAFLALFICNVLNVALSIVQDSYNHVKEVFQVCQFDQDKCDEKLALTSAKRGDDLENEVEDLQSELSVEELEHMISRLNRALNKKG